MIKWVATLLIVWFIYQVRHVFPPIIVGGIIAYLVLPIVGQLSQSTGLKRGWCTLIVYMTMAGVLVAAIWTLGPRVAHELKDLGSPDAQRDLIKGVITQFATQFHWNGDIEALAEHVIKSANDAIGKPEEIMHLGGALSHTALFVLVTVVSSIYFTLDAPLVGQFFLHYVPADRRASAVELTSKMNKILSKYVQGQIILIVIMSTVAWLILHFGFNVKYALPVALLSGFLEVIPVLGPILATTIATLVAVSQLGVHGLWIIPCYTLARWIEDYVVVPKVIGHAVELHPLAVIFAVLCGETLAGGLGMLIAIPVAACINIVIDFYFTGKLPGEDDHEDKKKRKLALEDLTRSRVDLLKEHAKDQDKAKDPPPATPPTATGESAKFETLLDTFDAKEQDK